MYNQLLESQHGVVPPCLPATVPLNNCAAVANTHTRTDSQRAAMHSLQGPNPSQSCIVALHLTAYSAAAQTQQLACKRHALVYTCTFVATHAMSGHICSALQPISHTSSSQFHTSHSQFLTHPAANSSHTQKHLQHCRMCDHLMAAATIYNAPGNQSTVHNQAENATFSVGSQRHHTTAMIT